MSGICGVWRKDDPGKASRTLRSLCTGTSLEPGDQIRMALADESCAVGACARFEGQQVFQSPRLILACDADLFNEDEIQTLTGASPSGGSAAMLAGLYERFGTA